MKPKSGSPGLGGGQRVAVLTFVAVIAGIAVWWMTGCNRDGDPAAPTSAAMAMGAGDARLVTEDELAVLPEEVGHEVYWAGTREGTEIEFTSDESGNVHLRYLTDGAEAGAAGQGFLNIGSYPFAGAYKATRELANVPGLVKVTEHNAVGFFDPANPYSVIVAWPEHPDLQIEVYDPVKNRALEVVRSGDIVPVS